MDPSVLSDAMPPCDRWTAREVDQRDDHLSIENGVLKPPSVSKQRGIMITVHRNRAQGYASTADLTPSGLRRAANRAADWADLAARHALLEEPIHPGNAIDHVFKTRVEQPYASVSLADKIDRIRVATQPFADATLNYWSGTFWNRDIRQILHTSEGSRIEQHLCQLMPMMMAVGAGPDGSIYRGMGRENGRQAGYEHIAASGFDHRASHILVELGQLQAAPLCPDERMDVLIDSSQMMLQIHESIGHPLEVDRILGDERNFAGTTFVTPDMVGSYQYGSELLNIVFDPTLTGELASYAYDDEGTPATREYLIRNGVLERVLGGALSQARSGLPGVACARAATWRRPVIDRMANLNLEPGTSSLNDLIGSVERGIYMQTNRSWSIDDSRDKFQFGCEYAQLIQDGELRDVVRNPNYRGRSRAFWRNLKGLGNADTYGVHGTPFCGKGEPNQVVAVGHASPACLFSDVAVFGGAA